MLPDNDQIKFIINPEHPVYLELIDSINLESRDLLKFYLKGLQAYLPLEAIQAQLNQNPHLIHQKEIMNEIDVTNLAGILNNLNLDEDVITSLLKTELFKNRQELLGRSSE
jgi:hypothetical protein